MRLSLGQFAAFCLWSLVATAALGASVPPSASVTSNARIDNIVIKLRGETDATAGLSREGWTAIYGALQVPFALTGFTRDGAYRLQLSDPLPIAAARNALNRVRMLPDVLYANMAATSSAMVTIASAAAPDATNAAQARPRLSRLIVKFRDAATSEASRRNEPLSRARLDQLTARGGHALAHERAMSGGAYVVRLLQAVPEDQAEALAATLETDPEVEYAEPDRLMHPLLVPNDPRYGEQWNFMGPSAGGVNMPPAWDITTGAANITVAVIDTGALPGHPDLAGRYIGGYDFVSDSAVANDGDGRDADASDPGDWVTSAENANPNGPFYRCGVSNSSFHGTHVAGIVGAASNNGIGVAGINWVSKILPVRVLGKCGGFTSDIADGIRWAAGISVVGAPSNPNPARVLNLSLGGSGNCGSTYQNAINAALGANAVVVVAAGNSNTDASQTAPANCSGVITVAATNYAGQRASYSNFGASVEIAAPGGGDGQAILSTLNSAALSPDPAGYNYVLYAGTSMATPHVAGIASLVLSVNPALTPAQVLAKIQTTARTFPTGTGRDCTTATCGAGIIDAGAAVASTSGLPSTTTTLATSGSPAVAGTNVTFTATVTGTNPTGSVTFVSDGSALCSGVTLVSGAASCSTSSLSVGTHSIVASYGGDANNAGSSSATLSQVITAPAGVANVALATAGAVASASSTYSSAYPVSSLNNNERTGAGWGAGGGWLDGTPGSFPDWVQIQFNGSKTIDRVVVYMVQDNYQQPVEPGDSLTFNDWGATDFTVQGWNGSSWVVLGTVTGNNLVKRTVTFNPFTTDRIRVNITAARSTWSLLTEVEAWSTTAPSLPSTTTTLGTSGSPVVAGTNVTFTATVTGTNPTGSVTFVSDGSALCSGVTLVSGAASCSTSSLSVGTHSIVASYGGDANNAGSSSATLSQVITAPAGVANVALATAGAVASASSTYSSAYPVSSLNNNERTGAGWGAGGGWLDGTPGSFPDWVQIQFNGSKTIDRVVVYMVQDNYQQPVEPGDSLTFNDWGATDFTVQGWNGSSWVVLGTVTGNNLVKRTVTFNPFTTDRIRVNITAARSTWSLLTEVEAWTAAP